MQHYKQVLAILLAFVLAFTCVPFTANAETGGSTAETKVLLDEGFSGDTSAWTADYGERWSVVDGAMQGIWEIDQSSSATYNSLIKYDGTGASGWKNYTVSTDATVYKYAEKEAYPYFGVAAYVSDAGRYELRVTTTKTGYSLRIYRRGSANGWATSATAYDLEGGNTQWGNEKVTFNVALEVTETAIVAYIDGVKALEYERTDAVDAELTAGTVGIYPLRGSSTNTTGTIKVLADNVKVETDDPTVGGSISDNTGEEGGTGTEGGTDEEGGSGDSASDSDSEPVNGSMNVNWVVTSSETNSYLGYKNETSDTWKNYSAEVDVTVSRYDLGDDTIDYPQFALCTYHTAAGRYEARVRISDAGYGVRIYRRNTSGSGTASGYVAGWAISSEDISSVYGDDTISYHVRVEMTETEMIVFINDMEVTRYTTTGESVITSGSVGLFAIRNDNKRSDTTLNIKMDNLLVKSLEGTEVYLNEEFYNNTTGWTTEKEAHAERWTFAEPGPFENIEFYDASLWDFAKSASNNAIALVPTITEDSIHIEFDGTDKGIGSGGAAYVLPAAQDWSNYRFGADMNVGTSEGGTHTWVGLRMYGQGESWTSQNTEGYEFLIQRTDDTAFNVRLRKCYANASTGKRTVSNLTTGSFSPKGGLKYDENGNIVFRAQMQMLDGVLTAYIDGVEALSYDTADEKVDTWNAAYTSGAVGFFVGRISSDKTLGYDVTFTNLTVGEAVEKEVPPAVEDTVVQNDRVIKNDDNFIVVSFEDFASYQADTMGTWSSSGYDNTDGKWEIRGGILVNDDNGGSNSSIALSDGEYYTFGSVITDVMLTTENTGNVYAGPVAAYNGAKNYYHMRIADLANGANRFQLWRMESGKAVQMASVDLETPIERDKWYQIEMSMVDGVIYGYLDGTLLITYDTSGDELKYTFGSVGVRSSQGTAIFDNFAVRIPREEETFSENFDSITNLADTKWDGTQADNGAGEWSVADGVLVQSASENASTNTGIMLYDDGQNLAFGGASVDVMITSDNAGNQYAGPVVAYNGAKNYYHMQLGDLKDGSAVVRLYQMTSGKANKKAEVTLSHKIEIGQWYNLEMQHYEGTILCYVDDVLVLSYTPEDGIAYTEGLVGVRVSQCSAKIDNFVAYGAASGASVKDLFNSTVVENPDVFTDDFNEETAGENPDYWLENNTVNNWKAAQLGDQKVYGMMSAGKTNITWLHVFETNVDFTADLYVASEGTDAAASAGLVTRLSGTGAYVRVAYDFAQSKWYVWDRKGMDFEEQTIYAAETSEFALDTWHTVRVRTVANNLEVWCDGVKVLETDEIGQVTTGRVGIYSDKAIVYADNVKLELLSGQGRVEKAALQNYVVLDAIEGGTFFQYDENTLLYCKGSTIYVSEDEGDTFRYITAEEESKYEFFKSQSYPQFIRLHNDWILKLGNYTSGQVWLSKDNGATYEQIAQLWDSSQFKWQFFLNMNDMVKEINLGDIDGDGQDNYRVFYCADARATGNADGSGSISYHWQEVYYTDDCGYTWQTSKFDTRWVQGTEHFVESRIVPCDDGTLRMYCSWQYTNNMRYLVSYDYGETWQDETALPQLRCSRSSFAYNVDPEDGTIYLAFCHVDPQDSGELNYKRNRFVLLRSVDGQNWEFLMDVWRWDDVPGDRLTNVNQIVDPALYITDDYIFITAGWAQWESDSSVHNAVRQTVLKVAKDDLVAYEEWPTNYGDPEEVVNISVTAPDKVLYQSGEALDLTGGYITVTHYGGSITVVPLTEAGVDISEPTIEINYTTEFPAPDMNVAGQKILRVRYADFADTFNILVVDANAEDGSAGDVDQYPMEFAINQEEIIEAITSGKAIEVENSVSTYELSGTMFTVGGSASVTVNGEAVDSMAVEATFEGYNVVFADTMNLAEGTNTITVVATDATGSKAEYTFTIVREVSQSSGSGSSGDSGSDNSSDNSSSSDSSTDSSQAAGTTTSGAVATGDDTNVWIWLVLAVAAVAAAGGLVYFRKAKEEKE